MTTEPSYLNLSPAELTTEGCLRRQAMLMTRLGERGIGAALIVGRRNVHYLTGHWARSVFPAAALVRNGRPTLLAAPMSTQAPAAESVIFKWDDFGTLRDNGTDLAVAALLKTVDQGSPLASDRGMWDRTTVPLGNDLLAMRRSKQPDEVALLKRAISAAEAAYGAAARTIRPGVTELELFAEVLSAATLAAGEPIGEVGNDFRSGSPGGPPRGRAMRDGELLPLDVGICVRGYTADLCRTFAVDGKPSAVQIDAHGRVTEVLYEIESQLRPGASCRELYAYAKYRLSGHGTATFGHHLGHGVGLAAHEAPRLNPESDDVLAVGDVFTIEPGLYAPDLNAGVRIEQMFLVTPTCVERLSNYPIGMT